MEVWKTEDPRVNFEKRFGHYEIYMWTLCHSYLHEKQTSRIQSLNDKCTRPRFNGPPERCEILNLLIALLNFILTHFDTILKVDTNNMSNLNL